MTEEIYPMPSFPMLIVRDLEASSNWYQDVLGFKHILPCRVSAESLLLSICGG